MCLSPFLCLGLRRLSHVRAGVCFSPCIHTIPGTVDVCSRRVRGWEGTQRIMRTLKPLRFHGHHSRTCTWRTHGLHAHAHRAQQSQDQGGGSPLGSPLGSRDMPPPMVRGILAPRSHMFPILPRWPPTRNIRPLYSSIFIFGWGHVFRYDAIHGAHVVNAY